MAITRTGIGTAIDSAKLTTNLTLTIASVSLQPGDFLAVGLSYDSGGGAPTVKWGQRLCKPVVTVSGNGIVSRIASMIYDGASARTRSLIATWTTSAPAAKFMCGSAFSPGQAFGFEDVTASQSQAATGSPSSGAGVTTTDAVQVLYGVFGSEGPSSDTVGTVSNSWTSGQRAGSTGAPPASNITGHEIYKITTATESAQAAKTGATARDHSTVMATFRFSPVYTLGISPSDIINAGEVLEAAGVDTGEMAFFWNLALGRWEAYTKDDNTLRARFDTTTSAWVSA